MDYKELKFSLDLRTVTFYDCSMAMIYYNNPIITYDNPKKCSICFIKSKNHNLNDFISVNPKINATTEKNPHLNTSYKRFASILFFNSLFQCCFGENLGGHSQNEFLLFGFICSAIGVFIGRFIWGRRKK